jgi:hypothetical protein
VLFDGHVWLLAKKDVLLDGGVWLLGNKACYLMDMCGYLQVKRVARWVCLVTWEQSVSFDGHVWLPANKARI